MRFMYLGVLVGIMVHGIFVDADAHDFGTEGKWNPQRAVFMPTDPVVFAPALPEDLPQILYLVAVLPKRWIAGEKINVCFVGGDDGIRSRILEAAAPWFVHANLRLVAGGPQGQTCRQKDDSEIRIGFSEPGYWSYIGRDGVNEYLIERNLVSMNLWGFDTSPPSEPEFSGIVLHEFGHALGFHHEHQSPAGGCEEEYDWDKLYDFYWRVYRWDRDMVDQNVRPLVADRSAYDWSELDPKSVMIYASDPRFLRDGPDSPCYFTKNNFLSELDVQGAQHTYPSQGVKLHLTARRDNLKMLIESGIGADLKNALSQQLRSTLEVLKKGEQ